MVTTSYPLFPGDGTAPFIQEIARGIVDRGHEVDVLLPAHPRLDTTALATRGLRFVPFSYAPIPSWSVWGYAQSLQADVGFKWRTLAVAPFAALATRRAYFRQVRTSPSYDVTHAHWVIPSGGLVAGLARRAGQPLVLSLHGSDVAVAERSRIVGAVARRAFEKARFVTACSSDLAHRAKVLGASPERARVVPYGVDIASFRAREATSATRARLGARPGETLVVAVGRLVEKKGFSDLITAARDLAGVHVAIVGDGDLQGELSALIGRLGAPVTLAGRFRREEVQEALACADIVAVPSVIDSRGNVDGLPNTLLEAMASGAAIVASRVAGIPDVIDDGRHGLLTPPRDPAALGRAIALLRDDVALRRSLGRAARERCEKELTWPRLAQTLEEIYVTATALA